MTMARHAAVLFLSVGIGACHKPILPVAPAQVTFTVADDDQFDALWESCQDVLRRYRFKLDRVDRHAGIITAFPVTSQQFFEFWRRDVATPYDLLAASLDTIRRRVTVRVQRGEDPSQVCQVAVAVEQERLSAPERQINNSAGVLRIFSEMPGEAGEAVLRRSDDSWVSRGRDGAMEDRLVRAIARQAAVAGTGPSS